MKDRSVVASSRVRATPSLDTVGVRESEGFPLGDATLKSRQEPNANVFVLQGSAPEASERRARRCSVSSRDETKEPVFRRSSSEPPARGPRADNNCESSDRQQPGQQLACDRNRLIKLQKSDTETKDMYAFISSNTSAFSPARRRKLGRVTAKLVIENEVLYQQTKKGNKIYLPASLRKAVLENSHDAPASGHFGVTRTALKIKKSFYWPGMDADIKGFVISCPKCQKFKPSQARKKGFLSTPPPSLPWQVVYVDHEGPLVRTPRGNKYLLVFQCASTRACELVAVRDSTALVTARHLFERVVCRHGAPVKIVSDAGPAFRSQVWREVCKLIGTEHHFCTPYWAQANRVERLNRDILRCLSIYASSHNTWDHGLPLLQYSLNTAVNATTGYSPFLLNHGRVPREVSDFISDEPCEPSTELTVQYAIHLKGLISEMRDDALARSKVTQEIYKLHYDKRKDPADFKVGDLVLVQNHAISKAVEKFTAKLAPLYFGPFEITKVLSDVTYELTCVRTGKVLPKRHAGQLKRYHPRIAGDAIPARNVTRTVTETEATSTLSPTLSSEQSPGDSEPKLPLEPTEPNIPVTGTCNAPWCTSDAHKDNSFVCPKCNERSHFICAGVYDIPSGSELCVICR